MAQVSAKQIRTALDDMDFPAAKQDLVQHAEARDADEDIRKALRSLPLGDYDNADEVVRSLDTVEATGQSRSGPAERAREHQHAGLAQHMRRSRS